MINTLTPTVFLLLPPDANRAVRSALMAMKALPQDVVPGSDGMKQLVRGMQEQPQAAALIDLDAMQPAVAHILELARLFGQASERKRIVLTRSRFGPVWSSDRDWVKRMGFCDMFAEFDSASLVAESHAFLDHVAQITDLASIEPRVLTQYYSAMQVRLERQSPRTVIRKTTGIDAESLCTLMASNVKSLDRTYHLKTYPSCFLGTEAVTWLANYFRMTRDMALLVGQALEKLGFIHHVVHEQAFADSPNFYRTVISSAADRLDMEAVFRLLKSQSGVDVRDRSYLGTTYTQCFIGSEAVSWVCGHYKISRPSAEAFLNRLWAFGLMEHVTREHKIQDGNFFYRFIA